MRRPDPAATEIILVVAAAAALATMGPWTGTGALPLALGLAGYTAWTMFQLNRYRKWMDHPKREPPPFRVGGWAPLSDIAISVRNQGKARKKRLRNILGGFHESTRILPDATVVLDKNWMVEWSNAVAQEFLGIPKPKDQPKDIFEYIDDPVFRDYLRKGDFSRPLQIPAPVDYGISLEVRVVPYGKGKHLIQARDITRLNQLETVRRDFVANVSHELRTPLTVVHGYIETMIDADDDEELDHWKPILGQMHEQSSRLQRIVEDLLTLSRLETRARTEGLEFIDMCRLIERIANSARSFSAGARHVIEVKCDPTVGLYGNPSEIESAFSNLVYNAVRYTPGAGRIKLSWWQGDGKVFFSTADNGVGIEAKHIPRLTERFYRVDVGRSREKGGTGLGLAIVKHVLLRHGGALRIESQPGVGSTFTCCLPADRIRHIQAGDFPD
ncbi:MAG: phosphate regulon sensor histidine kinase PhoR [Sedimenticolaceae bacterium]